MTDLRSNPVTANTEDFPPLVTVRTNKKTVFFHYCEWERSRDRSLEGLTLPGKHASL